MTAPKPLPRCPVCGRAPLPCERRWAHFSVRFSRECSRSTSTTEHDICTAGSTQAEADARWRRLAGGRK